MHLLCRVGSVVSVSAYHRTVVRGFASQAGHTKDHHKKGRNCLPALHCLWVHALKISPGINRKIRVLYPGLGFVSIVLHGGIFVRYILLLRR